MKRFFQIALFLSFTIAMVMLLIYVYLKHEQEPLQKVMIHLSRDGEKGFLNRDEIISCVESHLNDTIRLQDVNLEFIEDSLAQTPWVDKIDAYTDIEGNLIINILESKPVLRVFNQFGKSFYLDEKGKILPLSNHYAPHLLIANGYIQTNPVHGYNNINDTIYKKSDLKKLLAISKGINRYKFLRSLLSEVYLNSRHEFDLIPVVGNQIIRLGDTTNLTHKLENLVIFYKKSLVYEGWDTYKTVNLKYRNQIVCTKK